MSDPRPLSTAGTSTALPSARRALLTLLALAVLGSSSAAAGSLVAMSMTDPSFVGVGAGGEAWWWESRQATSADGRYVVFRSRHPDLVAGYSGAGYQIYRYDRVADTMTLISHSASSPAEGGNCDSQSASISADGTKVAFWSCANNLVAGYSGSGYQIYMWDSGSVSLVSHDANSATTGGDCDSNSPVLSADGTKLAFLSCASNLVAGYGGSSYQIYLWASGSVSLVSHDASSATTGGDCDSYQPVLSPDGTKVAFLSCASNLVAGYSGAGYQIYRYDLVADTMTLISHSASSPAEGGNCDSQSASISADGTNVAFWSCASNLVAGYSGSGYQIYLWDSGSVSLVSHDASSTTAGANCYSYEPFLSADGTKVAFSSCASNLIAGYSGSNYQIYLWDSGSVSLVSHDVSSATTGSTCHSYQPVLSADGTKVAFSSCASNLVAGYSGSGNYQIYLWDSGSVSLVSHELGSTTTGGNAYTELADLSEDGSTLVFTSQANNLVAGDAGSGYDVFAADVATGTLGWVSRRDAAIPWQPATGSGSSWPSIRPKRTVSEDGRYTAYMSSAPDLVSGFSGAGPYNVYLYDRLAGTNTLVSHADGASATGGDCQSQEPTISEDGSSVVFLSCATNLVSGMAGSGYYQVYLWERATGAITLVSHAAGAVTTAGNCPSYRQQVSADGQTVAFWSCATDLVSGYAPAGGSYQIYLWDRPSGSVSLVSHAPGSAAVGGSCDSGSDWYQTWTGYDLAADGHSIAFTSCATNLVAGYTSGGSSLNVYHWDRATDTTHLVSEDASTPLLGAGCDAVQPTISADGGHVAYQSCATNLVPGYVGGGTWQVFAWDAGTGESRLVSHADGASASAANCHAYPGWWDSRAEISGDGQWVAYLSCATDLLPTGAPGGAGIQLYLSETSGASTRLVSHVAGAPATGSACESYQPSVSHDASTVAFVNCAGDLVPGLSGSAPWQVYAWDRTADVAELGSGRLGSATQRGISDAYWPVVSSDGSSIVFRSWSYDLVARDFNNSDDAFHWSLAFTPDTSAPSDPTSLAAQAPHVEGSWSNQATVTMEWAGAEDEPGGSGLAGYSVEWNHLPVSTPDDVVDVPHGSDPHTFAAAPGEGADWYFHLRTCDVAGNCTATLHAGPFGIDTTAPGAPGAVTSSTHGDGLPKSATTIEVGWDPATDGLSGVAFYRYGFTDSATAPACGSLGDTTASASASSAAMVDGTWYAHVCAVDAAGTEGQVSTGGPYVVDTAGPTGLLVTSSSHAVSTWSNDATIDFGFSGATDANGVVGYAVAFDTAAGTVPACSSTQVGTSFTGTATPDGDSWWIHVRAVDAAGNCGDTVHLGPFWIDTTAPGAPGAVVSSSHDGGPVNDPTIDVEWGAATDVTGSGIDGYSYFFSPGEDDDCDGTADLDESERAATSPPLAAGTWYLHVCAVDRAGNWGPVTTGGPYTIDLSAPEVSNIDSVASSGGSIGEGEVVGVAVTELLIGFNEPMDEPLAETLSSYLLVEAGTDGTLETADCSGVAGSDVAVAIDSAAYAGTTSTLGIHGGVALGDGFYRLFVCGGLEDVAGNALDGDGDGVGGDAFVRTFRVDLSPPSVASVDSVTDTGDGQIAEDEATNVSITELKVTFSEAIVEALAESSSEWLLVGSGSGSFETLDCAGGVLGDDLAVAIDQVIWDGPSLTATLEINGGVALADGLYRLFACATLTDLGGNPLDGDGDGVSGDDFVRTFLVDTVPPANPTAITSPTHPYLGFSASTAFTAEWSGASDDASGLAGYSVVIDGSPSSAVDETIEAADGSGGGSFSTALAEGTWYVHVRACDRAGNCAAGVAEDGFWGIDTSAPGAPGPVTSSSHDPAGTPVADSTIDVAWGAASDGVSSVVSYDYAFDGSAGGSCTGGASTASLTGASGALADGSWYVHVCAVDAAGNRGEAVHGGPWIVDTAGPSGLSVASSSHAVSTWSSDSTIDFGFTGASDANGVAGYAVAFDAAADTVPACAATQSTTSFTGSSSPDGDSWWIHVRAVDAAGNCGDTVHLGPFRIDTTAPGAPGAVVSSSHDGGPVNDPTIDVEWGAATDGSGSGIDGYSYFFSPGEDDDCDGTADLDESERAATSPPLAAGTWYLHVCAVDRAGNWGPVTTGGPYTIDLSAPEVANVDSLASSGGAIGEGEVVNVEITELLVSFDEAMDEPLAETLGSYLLVGAGVDGTLETADCSAVAGSDVAVDIDTAAYAGTTSTLGVNGGVALVDGLYRLLACPALEDVAGNALDGNGDGVGGDAFVRTFRVDLSAPSVVAVDTVADTGDGALVEDEATNAAITELLVSFSEAMVEALAESSSEWVLVGSGDGSFETLDCAGGVLGDDVAVAIDTITWDEPTLTARLEVNGGAALADGRYRLFACATLTDSGGNPLDGNADGTVGDDFTRTFLVDTVPPENPTAITSPTHPYLGFSASTAFTAEWSGASDDASGLAGYSVVIDGSPSSAVDETIEAADGSGGGSFSTALAEGTWYVHVRACDRAGNCAAGVAEDGFWGIDTSAPGAPGAVSSSSHDPAGTPVADATIDVAWGAASDGVSSVVSYDYAFDGSAGGSCTGGASTASLTGASGALADGSWYVHVCAVDAAGNRGEAVHGGPWIVDTAGPSGLSVASSSHAVSTWSSDNTIDFGFSGASDANGVAGYAVAFDQASGTVPGCAATQSTSSFTGSSSPDGDSWWIHVRAVDVAGNCGEAAHLGPFWIDTTAPGAPGAVVSSSHDGGPTNDPTIDVEWGAASDGSGSGIDGYSYLFNGIDQDCDGVADLDESERSATSPPLAAGTWYVHVCAVDRAGNWSPVTTGGPYTIDLSAPEVSNVDSVASSGGAIGEGEVVNVEITELLVSFDEAMDEPLAETLGSYLLVEAGTDGTLESGDCSGVAGTDTPVAIDTADYAGTTATLGVDGGALLGDGLYRLLVCPALEDVAGNALDGNGDGVGGDAFVRTFRVDLSPPSVVEVDSVADTGDGQVAENEATNVAITELLVAFDEAMVEALAESSSEWVLVGSGDGSFETLDCAGGVLGDDLAVAIDQVIWDEPSLTATLEVNGGVALADGRYRLFACATLTDLGGNPLDGNADGTPGDDFARTFVVDTVPPENPTAITSPTHPYLGWSASTAFTAEWSGASDDASGLAGYSVVIDGSPSSAVDETIEATDSSGGGSFSTTLGEGAWYVHVRACDRAGNCAAGVAEAGFWGVDTSAPSAPGAVSSPSHGLVWSPRSNVVIEIEWGAAGDAVSAVAHYLYAFDDQPVGSCAGGSSSATLTGQSAPLADGAWYAHVCAVDLAGNVGAAAHGGPWVVDTTPPSGLVVASSSHAVAAWSNDDSIDFGFSGATDANGVDGYAVVFDTAAGTVPACATTQAGTSYAGNASPDGDAWWIHVRAVDVAGNCGGAVHLGPFWIDTVAPGTVSGLVSTDHAVGLPSIDPTIAVSWTPAADDRSGVAAYSVQFDGGDGGDCDDTDDTTSPEFVSAPLGHGEWWARVCARDQAGNWGAVVSAGPYTIDLVAPGVLEVASTAATTDGVVAEGEVVGVAVTELRLRFSERMSTSAGLATSFRLISDAGDGFQTLSCAGGVSPQDASVAIGAAALDGTGTLATLAVNGGAALPTGSYRLFACASLTDAAGNHLDGDSDGDSAEDFVRSFSVDRSPPEVDLVESTAASAGAGLDEDEATNAAVTHLHVTFDEPVYDPIGDTNPDDVTNPVNYRLVGSGGDGFQTLSCQAGVDPADVAVAIDAVAYDGPTRTATLAVNGGLPLGEERYRLFVCGTAAIVDLAGLPLDGDGDGVGGDDFARSFQIDTTAPSNPALAANLPVGVWTNLTGLTVTWSGATDEAEGSGLAGYAALFDLAAGSDPGTGIDVAEAAAHAASATLADAATHHFHLRACDRAGNCAAPVEIGPFQVDTQAPAAATGLASSSHEVGVASNDTTIEVAWSAAEDQPGLSGIGGYDFAFVAGGDDDCDGLEDGEETDLSTTSPPLADGEWWFRVCAVDHAGNWGARASIGPFVIDTAASVASVGTVADTGDGVLDEAEATLGGVTQLLVAFDGAMADPPGDGSPEDVTNPANFRLYEAGADGDLATVACGAPSGDDLEVAVASSEYSATETTAALSFAGSHTLDAGRYRLLVCPTLEDEAGTPVAAFARDFAVTVRDQLANPNFDASLAGWVLTEPAPGSLAWSAADAGGAASSGSAEIVASGGLGEVWGLSQCFELPAGPFHGRARVQVESAAADAPEVELRLDFFDAAACAGALVDSSVSPPVAGDTGGAWPVVELDRPSEPVAAQSVLVTARVLGGAATSFTARVDDLFYGRTLDLLSDGFETGDFRRWSGVVGEP